jgi:competence protein ComEA
MDRTSSPWRTLEATQEPDPAPAVGRAAGLRLPIIGTLAAAIGISLVAVAIVASGPRPSAVVGADVAAVADVARSAAPATPPQAQIVVHVAGAVRRPGLVRLPPGSRVADAIEAAGGLGPRVDGARVDRELNLAAPVADGDHIVVPSRDDPATAAGEAGSRATGSPGTAPAGKVDLNHAGAEALDALPGIGPATAAKIIAARQERAFRSLDELVSRKVLGEATLTKIRGLVELR